MHACACSHRTRTHTHTHLSWVMLNENKNESSGPKKGTTFLFFTALCLSLFSDYVIILNDLLKYVILRMHSQLLTFGCVNFHNYVKHRFLRFCNVNGERKRCLKLSTCYQGKKISVLKFIVKRQTRNLRTSIMPDLCDSYSCEQK